MSACVAIIAGKGIRFTGMGRTGEGAGKNLGVEIPGISVRVFDAHAIAVSAILAVMIMTLAQAAQAGDWPMKGHDLSHSGVADEVVELPLGLLWKYTTGDIVPSSPAVSGSVIYVESSDNNVYALDSAIGVLKWKYMTGGGVDPSPNEKN